ncbi:MAG: hypothetical protein HQL32_09520 [Planctomycetes bacterium]|nr:hypothetical protein [Planctomycetota bacterium]
MFIKIVLKLVTGVVFATLLIYFTLLFLPSNITHTYALDPCICGPTLAIFSNGSIIYVSDPHSTNISGNVIGHYKEIEEKFHIFYAGNLQSPFAVTELDYFGFYSDQDKQYIIQRSDPLKYYSLFFYSRFFNKDYLGENEY